MPADPLLLGVDVGTTATKGGVFDLAGRPLAFARSGYPVQRPRAGWATQDPAAWWRAFERVVGELGARTGLDRIAGVGVCSQVNTHVVADASGTPLMPAITWQDTRCAAIAAELDAELSAADRARLWDAPAGVDGSSAIARAAWLQRTVPDIHAQTRWLLSPKDWINWRLTGEVATDPISPIGLVGADGTYLHGVMEHWSGLAHLMPPIRAITDLAGTTAARTAGLPNGAPVVVATMDAWGNRYGSGLVGAGQAMDVAGTSEILALLSGTSDPRPGIVSFIPIDGLVLHAGPTQAGGDALRWLGEAVRAPRDRLLADAAAAPPGAGGVVFLPYLGGERAPLWDSSARAAFVGVDADHGRGELARAVLEGVACAARHVLETAAAAGGIDPETVTISGGGARSDLWCQIKADLLGVPVRRVEVIDSGVLGAALMAGAGAGLLPDLPHAAGEAVRVERVFEPDPRHRSRYDELYGIYRDLYPALGPAYGRLARWREEAATAAEPGREPA